MEPTIVVDVSGTWIVRFLAGGKMIFGTRPKGQSFVSSAVLEVQPVPLACWRYFAF